MILDVGRGRCVLCLNPNPTGLVMSSKFDLDLHMFRLMESEPFFAAISRRIDKRPSTAIPTAGVRVNPDTAQLEMLYNPSLS